MINFNIDIGEYLVKVIEKIENSSKFRQLLWAIVAIFAIYALSALIAAVRWW